jgi:hypothetical protein
VGLLGRSGVLIQRLKPAGAAPFTVTVPSAGSQKRPGLR